MKKPSKPQSNPSSADLKSEYRLDYTKAKPNRFANRPRTQPVLVLLEPDVAKIFKDSDSVNNVLRSIVNSLPKTKKIAS